MDILYDPTRYAAIGQDADCVEFGHFYINRPHWAYVAHRGEIVGMEIWNISDDRCMFCQEPQIGTD